MNSHEEIIRQLMSDRGICSPEDIEEYLSDRPQRTYDPFLMQGMQEGVDLILEEINAGTRICVYGDYDADGVTSVCILMSVLTRLTDNVTVGASYMGAYRKDYQEHTGLIKFKYDF